jgi:hypothetical protein
VHQSSIPLTPSCIRHDSMDRRPDRPDTFWARDPVDTVDTDDTVNFGVLSPQNCSIVTAYSVAKPPLTLYDTESSNLGRRRSEPLYRHLCHTVSKAVLRHCKVREPQNSAVFRRVFTVSSVSSVSTGSRRGSRREGLRGGTRIPSRINQ